MIAQGSVNHSEIARSTRKDHQAETSDKQNIHLPTMMKLPSLLNVSSGSNVPITTPSFSTPSFSTPSFSTPSLSSSISSAASSQPFRFLDFDEILRLKKLHSTDPDLAKSLMRQISGTPSTENPTNPFINSNVSLLEPQKVNQTRSDKESILTSGYSSPRRGRPRKITLDSNKEKRTAILDNDNVSVFQAESANLTNTGVKISTPKNNLNDENLLGVSYRPANTQVGDTNRENRLTKGVAVSNSTHSENSDFMMNGKRTVESDDTSKFSEGISLYQNFKKSASMNSNDETNHKSIPFTPRKVGRPRLSEEEKAKRKQLKKRKDKPATIKLEKKQKSNIIQESDEEVTKVFVAIAKHENPGARKDFVYRTREKKLQVLEKQDGIIKADVFTSRKRKNAGSLHLPKANHTTLKNGFALFSSSKNKLINISPRKTPNGRAGSPKKIIEGVDNRYSCVSIEKHEVDGQDLSRNTHAKLISLPENTGDDIDQIIRESKSGREENDGICSIKDLNSRKLSTKKLTVPSYEQQNQRALQLPSKSIIASSYKTQTKRSNNSQFASPFNNKYGIPFENDSFKASPLPTSKDDEDFFERKFADDALFLDGPDGYFDQHRMKLLSSNNSMIQAPVVDYDEFNSLILLSGFLHHNQKYQLLQKYKQMYTQWVFELEQNFNLLFYGIGSKRNFILSFVQDFLQERVEENVETIVVNGYIPAITLKEVLAQIVKTLKIPRAPKIISELVEYLVDYFSTKPKTARLILVIHNIDGPSFRDEKTQDFLSRIASIKQIYLLCSVDHVSAPLLWDSNRLTNFNFVWNNVTTYMDYLTETSFEDPLLLGQTQKSSGSKGAKYVLSSLTTNAKDLYRILASNQLQTMEDDLQTKRDQTDATLKGTVKHALEFQHFFSLCVEEFITSNEVTFRTMLTEFIEHKMCILVKDDTATEMVYIPFTMSEISKLLTDELL